MPPSDAFCEPFPCLRAVQRTTINNGSSGNDMIGGVVDGRCDRLHGRRHALSFYGGTNLDDDGVFLLGNGTVNWPMVYNWGYTSICRDDTDWKGLHLQLLRPVRL